MIPKRPNLAEYGEYLGLGIQIAGSLLVPLLGGIWLDNKFDLFPWLTVAGALFGIVSIFAIVFKIAWIANQESERKKAQKRNSESIKNK
jgi:F0F1-type ATP synthase assembly protein I